MLTGGQARSGHVHELISFVARRDDFFYNEITARRGLHSHIANFINHVDTLHPPVLVRETKDYIVSVARGIYTPANWLLYTSNQVSGQGQVDISSEVNVVSN